MKKYPVLLPVLMFFLCALVLFGLNIGLENTRREIAVREHVELMKTLLPGSEEFRREEVDSEDPIIRSAHKANNGYVIETVTAGYVGEIRMIIGVTNDGHVTGLVVRDLSETKGLGARALTDTGFLTQFLNTSGDAEIGAGIDALTGATVTSKAVARSINAAVAYVTGADTSSGATSWGG